MVFNARENRSRGNIAHPFNISETDICSKDIPPYGVSFTTECEVDPRDEDAFTVDIVFGEDDEKGFDFRVQW